MFMQDEDSIVMTIDMHLTFPIGTVEYVRKVCYHNGMQKLHNLQQGTAFTIPYKHHLCRDF